MSFSKASTKTFTRSIWRGANWTRKQENNRKQNNDNILKRKKSATKIVAIACEWNISCGAFYIWPEANKLNTFNKYGWWWANTMNTFFQQTEKTNVAACLGKSSNEERLLRDNINNIHATRKHKHIVTKWKSKPHTWPCRMPYTGHNRTVSYTFLAHELGNLVQQLYNV